MHRRNFSLSAMQQSRDGVTNAWNAEICLLNYLHDDSSAKGKTAPRVVHSPVALVGDGDHKVGRRMLRGVEELVFVGVSCEKMSDCFLGMLWDAQSPAKPGQSTVTSPHLSLG